MRSHALSDDSLFREVDEEVRQEQFKKLWSRYGKFVIGLVIVVILGVAGALATRHAGLHRLGRIGIGFGLGLFS